MSTVLRIAMTFFSAVPLQRWMNWIAAALMGFALVNLGNDGVMFLAVPAALLAVMVPAFWGGAALRHACTPSLLHVRPHGRAKLLLGATLALTLVAAIAALPFQIEAWSSEAGSARRADVPSAAFMFQIAWSALVIMWIALFAISRSQLAYALLGVLPVFVFLTGQRLLMHFGPLDWLLPGAALLWVGFGAWLMRTHQVARPAVMPSGTSSDAHPFGGLMQLLPLSGRSTPANARSLHLLGGTLSMFVVNGIWIALIFGVVHLTMGNNGRGPGVYGSMFMLPFLGFMFAAVGFTTARRARMLWLRSGLDRGALFRQAEVTGLRAMLISWLIPAAVIIFAVVVRTQRPLPMLLAFALPALALAVGLFYGGMAMTRGLCVRDAVLALVLGVLFMAELALMHPARELSASNAAIAFAGALLAIVALRSYAMRAWRQLDWRVAKMPAPTARTT